MWRNIKYQMFVLALLPPTLVIIVMNVLLAQSRATDIDEFAEARAFALMNQIEIAAQFALAEDNLTMLQSITNSSLEEKGLRSATVYRDDKSILVHSGMRLDRRVDSKNWLDGNSKTLNVNDLLIFIKPLHSNNVSDIQAGWIVVAYQRDIFVVKRYEQWLVYNLTLLLLLFLCAGTGLFIGHYYSKNLAQLRDYIKRLQDGVSETPPVSISREMNLIGDAITDLHQSTITEIEDLQYNIELASGDLRSSIESMEIQNIQLSLMQKEALAASRIKSEFLANTSHEIRTPLNGIMGFTRILKRTPLNPQQLDYVETIEQSSQGLLAIINDILDFSKIEAGKLELEENLFDLQQCCEDVVSLFAPAAAEKKLELILFFYQDVPQFLMGDAMRIRQILSNLVSNAIKFTPEGNIVIRVALEQFNNQQTVISFSVQDTGIGMDSQQTQQLFTAFNQANASISREYGGTGLGLAIVKKLVDLLQGDINVDSIPNEGTTITFTVRLRTSNKKVTIDNSLKGKSILLIEQNNLAANALRNMLENWALHVSQAEHLLQAEQLLELHHFDCILFSASFDQRDEDIYFQAQQIHAQSQHPLIVLLPTGRDASSKLLEQAGFTVSFKPCIRPRLFKLINQLIGKPITAIVSKHPINVLAVDDQPTNLKLLSVLFEDKPIKLSLANDGTKAIQLCQQQAFDLILMDIQMPGMSGLEASQTIRRLELNRRTPIIAVTAHALDDEKHQLLQNGINDYLSKPISEEQLEHIIATWIMEKNQPASVDIHVCLKLAQNKKELAIELFTALINELPTALVAIEEVSNTDQLSSSLALVHKLHGLSCYTGVPMLKISLANLEAAIKQQAHIDKTLVDNLIEASEDLLVWAKHHNFANEIDSYN